MNEWTKNKKASAIPFNALLAFEVTARHMSLKDAANELNITPSAVSYRLRQLEKVLGYQLFRRDGSQITLTARGQILAPALSGGFSQIIEAVNRLQCDERTETE
jgi:LysR family transcriptional regulator, glycine cleavage system transcriptional activator